MSTQKTSGIVSLPSSDACLRVFDSQEYAESFARGEIWMSPLSRYREMGDTPDSTGDALEGIMLVEGEGAVCPLTSTAASSAVILSTTALVDHALEQICADGERRLFRIKDDYSEYAFQEERGAGESYGVVFSASKLIARLKHYADDNNLVFMSKLVRYDDGNLPLEEFGAVCSGGRLLDETLFGKRLSFSNQYEYRFVIAPKQSDIEAGIRLPLNEQGFYVANVEPFICDGIQMLM